MRCQGWYEINTFVSLYGIDLMGDETYVFDVTSLDFTFHAIGLHYCIRTWRAATKALLAFPGTESHTLV